MRIGPELSIKIIVPGGKRMPDYSSKNQPCIKLI
jgi:hypothetical protein